jgi:formylglycine-generating enzyme required for sulfatase activity
MTEIWFGRYEIIEKLGGGGYGTVYRMLDRVLEMERAVKVLHPGLNGDAQFVERFRREARLAVRLKHPHIVPVLDFGEAEGRYYLVMEYLPGGSLARRLQVQGAFSLADAADLAGQVADALDYLHAQNLAHCDLKPDNVLFDAEGRAVLVDFGFARAAHGASSTTASISQGLFGTPGYMAPEQMDVSRAAMVGPASDVYALGVIVFELLGGRKPFEGSTPALIGAHLLSPPPLLRSLRPELPEGMELLVQQALSKDPAARPLPAGGFASRMAKLARLEPEPPGAAPTAGKAQAPPPLELDPGELALDEKHAEGALSPARRLRSGKTVNNVWELLAALQADPDETLVPLYTGTLEAWLSPVLTPAAQALLAQIPQMEEDRKRGAQRFSDAFVPLLISDAVNRGRLALGQGDWGKADAFASQALLVQPENKAATHLRQQATAGALKTARAAWREGNAYQAAALAKQVLKLLPQDPEAEYLDQQSSQVLELGKRFQEHCQAQQVSQARQALDALLAVCPQWYGQKEAQELLGKTGERQQQEAEQKRQEARQYTNQTGIEWVEIPAGEFLYGDNKKMQRIPQPFMIGKYPVTQAQYKKFLDENPGYPTPSDWDQKKRIYPTGKEHHPVVNVSWNDAQAFCQWANCRLPTEEEWERAARGTDGRIYPWGNEEPDPSRANFNQNIKDTTPVGKYSPRGDSPGGCADMAGNVWEWTASKYDANRYVLRGGSWINDANILRVAYRYSVDPSGRYNSIGFRCAFSL